MYYVDEFGYEFNIPRRPTESVVEHQRTGHQIIFDFFRLMDKRLSKNSTENPFVKEAHNAE